MAAYEQKERKIFEKLPFDFEEPNDDELSKLLSMYGSYVFVGPKRYLEPGKYKTVGLDIYNFEVRPDDVYLVGFPRSGTTLHCEMVWLIANDLDYEEASKNFLDYRFPHIDFNIIGTLDSLDAISKNEDLSQEGREVIEKYKELDLKGLSERKGRRFIKSHLPLSLMPPNIFEVGAKVIYSARHPKDAIASMYRLLDSSQFIENLDFKKGLFDGFTNDLFINCPYFENVKEAWERRNDENFLFLFYEDTLKDKRKAIQRVADFLGKSLSKAQIDSLEDHLSFEKFKNNTSVNCDQLAKVRFTKKTGNFISEGKTGTWKKLFDEEMEKKFDRWMGENLEGTDLKFPEK